jgi:hypothetical protein
LSELETPRHGIFSSTKYSRISPFQVLRSKTSIGVAPEKIFGRWVKIRQALPAFSQGRFYEHLQQPCGLLTNNPKIAPAKKRAAHWRLFCE